MLLPVQGSVQGPSQKLVEVICLDEDDEDCVVVEKTVHIRVEKTVEVLQRGDEEIRYDTVVERRVEKVVKERGAEDATAAATVVDVSNGGIGGSLEDKLLDDLQDTTVSKEAGDASKSEDATAAPSVVDVPNGGIGRSPQDKLLDDLQAITVAKEAGDASNSEDDSSEEGKRLQEKLCLLASNVGHRGEADEDEESNLVTEKLEKEEGRKGVSDPDSEGDDAAMAALLAQSLRKFLTERPTSRKETTTPVTFKPESSSSSGDEDDGMMDIDDSRKRNADETAAMALQTVWIPAETGLPKIDSKMPSAPSRTIPQRMEESLADGLLVPTRDAKKQRKLAKKTLKESTGAKWFDMAAPTVTPQIRKEFQLLQLRNVIDPKRHYKPNDTKGIPKYFQIGTVVEGHADFYSGRLTKKECKQSLADELLGNTDLKNYRKRKYTEIQEQKSAGGKNFYKQKKNLQKSSRANR